MNAYELADKAEAMKTGEYGYVDGWIEEAAYMLRQQADRIILLEAYLKSEADRIAELERLVSDMRYEKSSGVYDHPHKELSDEEIMKHFSEYWNHIGQIQIDEDFLLIAIRAIIKASRGEE